MFVVFNNSTVLGEKEPATFIDFIFYLGMQQQSSLQAKLAKWRISAH